MKKFVIILGIICLILLGFFSFLFIKNRSIIQEEPLYIKENNISTESSTDWYVESIRERENKYAETEHEYTETRKNILNTQNKAKKLKNLDQNFISVFEDEVLNELSKKESDWDKTTKIASLSVAEYLSDNIQALYDYNSPIFEVDGNIESIYWDWGTDIINISYMRDEQEYNKVYKCELIEDSKNNNIMKIDSIELLCDSGEKPQPYIFLNVYDLNYMNPFIEIIRENYNVTDYFNLCFSDNTYEFTDEFIENTENKKLLLKTIDDEIPINFIKIYEEETDDIRNWDADSIKICVETLENSRYMEYYYQIDLSRGENYSLKDYKTKYIKKLKGETVEEREKREATEINEFADFEYTENETTIKVPSENPIFAGNPPDNNNPRFLTEEMEEQIKK